MFRPDTTLILLSKAIILFAVAAFILSGWIYIHYRYFLPLSVPCTSATGWEGSAPHGAIWKKEIVHWPQVRAGYWTATGWINAATVTPCADASAVAPLVEIRVLRLVERDRLGDESIVAEIRPENPEQFAGRLFPRVPKWFGETEGRNEIDITKSSDEALSLDLGQAPLRVYHGWMEPKIEIDPSRTYAVEVEAKINATARLQIGLDYWRTLKSAYTGWDPRCIQSNNCEAFVSDWYGDTEGEFRTFRAPLQASDASALPI